MSKIVYPRLCKYDANCGMFNSPLLLGEHYQTVHAEAHATDTKRANNLRYRGTKTAAVEGPGQKVRTYLDLLLNPPSKLKLRKAEVVRKRLAEVKEIGASADSLTKLAMIQRRMDLEAELAVIEFEESYEDELVDAEHEFVAIGKKYATEQKISYAAFREIGVPASILKDAGIERFVKNGGES